MTTPLSSSRIDDLLSELQLLESKGPSSPAPLSFIPVSPPRIAETAAKEAVIHKVVPQEKKEAVPLPKPLNTFAIAAVCSLLFFALGLFSADFFITGTEEVAPDITNIALEALPYHPEVAALQGQFSYLFQERQNYLLSAINEGSLDLNKKARDSHHLTSLALLNAWQTLDNPELRKDFVDLAVKEGLGSFLPVQVTSEEKLRPLYYFSDSELHLNLTKLHHTILHDIP